MVIYFFKQQDMNTKLRVTALQEQRKKLNSLELMVIATNVSMFLKQFCCYFHFCFYQEARPNLTDDDVKRRTKKRKMDDLRKNSV